LIFFRLIRVDQIKTPSYNWEFDGLLTNLDSSAQDHLDYMNCCVPSLPLIPPTSPKHKILHSDDENGQNGPHNILEEPMPFVIPPSAHDATYYQTLRQEIDNLRTKNKQLEQLVSSSLLHQRKSSSANHISNSISVPNLHSPNRPLDSGMAHEQLNESQKPPFPALHNPLFSIHPSLAKLDPDPLSKEPIHEANPPDHLVAVSSWLVTSVKCADDWRLLECNSAFLEMLDLPVESLTSSTLTFLHFVPIRYQSAASQLLRHIIIVGFF
jgi:hypothetical protein